jgi:hypothetical protein
MDNPGAADAAVLKKELGERAVGAQHPRNRDCALALYRIVPEINVGESRVGPE